MTILWINLLLWSSASSLMFGFAATLESFQSLSINCIRVLRVFACQATFLHLVSMLKIHSLCGIHLNLNVKPAFPKFHFKQKIIWLKSCLSQTCCWTRTKKLFSASLIEGTSSRKSYFGSWNFVQYRKLEGWKGNEPICHKPYSSLSFRFELMPFYDWALFQPCC